ncbi:MAG: hypothetical protein U0Q16_15305 [Bryobacteraceae bacterium]
MATLLEPTYFVGVDLGQRRDHTALAVIESATLIRDERDPVSFAFLEEHRLSVTALEQLPLGIPYTTIAGYIEKAVGHQSLWKNCLLAIDATGVGQPIFDLLRNCRLPVKDLRAVIITSGERPSRSGHTDNIPRRALLHNLHSRTIGRQYKVSGKLPHARTLIRELAQLQVRLDDAGNESIAPSQHSQHDDLVFATAIALWYATRSGARPTLAPKQGRLL